MHNRNHEEKFKTKIYKNLCKHFLKLSFFCEILLINSNETRLDVVRKILYFIKLKYSQKLGLLI